MIVYPREQPQQPGGPPHEDGGGVRAIWSSSVEPEVGARREWDTAQDFGKNDKKIIKF